MPGWTDRVFAELVRLGLGSTYESRTYEWGVGALIWLLNVDKVTY